MQIIVVTPTGEEVLFVKPSNTVDYVKNLLFEKTGVPPQQQTLSFNGKILDDMTVLEWMIGLGEGSILELTLPEGNTMPPPPTTTASSTTTATEPEEADPSRSYMFVGLGVGLPFIAVGALWYKHKRDNAPAKVTPSYIADEQLKKVEEGKKTHHHQQHHHHHHAKEAFSIDSKLDDVDDTDDDCSPVKTSPQLVKKPHPEVIRKSTIELLDELHATNAPTSEGANGNVLEAWSANDTGTEHAHHGIQMHPPQHHHHGHEEHTSEMKHHTFTPKWHKKAETTEPKRRINRSPTQPFRQTATPQAPTGAHPLDTGARQIVMADVPTENPGSETEVQALRNAARHNQFSMTLVGMPPAPDVVVTDVEVAEPAPILAPTPASSPAPAPTPPPAPAPKPPPRKAGSHSHSHSHHGSLSSEEAAFLSSHSHAGSHSHSHSASHSHTASGAVPPPPQLPGAVPPPPQVTGAGNAHNTALGAVRPPPQARHTVPNAVRPPPQLPKSIHPPEATATTTAAMRRKTEKRMLHDPEKHHRCTSQQGKKVLLE